MYYRNAIALGVYPLWACVKVGDTPSDIAEGLNAGMWTIGITRTGNEVGLSKVELDALSQADRAEVERMLASDAALRAELQQLGGAVDRPAICTPARARW